MLSFELGNKVLFFRLKILAVFAVFIPAALQEALAAQVASDDNMPNHEVSIPRDNDFVLKADYFAGKRKADGFLILHDCQSDRQDYHPITAQLADNSYHVLSLDLRGFGRSVSETYNHQKMKSNAKDIISYQVLLGQLSSFWQDDVLAAFEYLRTKLDKASKISILTSGCSAPFAIAAAEQWHVSNMVMLTPEMTFADKERYKNLTDIATFFVASVHHVETYQTTKELFEWNGHTGTKMLSYKGETKDIQLLKRSRSLSSDIAAWLMERSR